MARHPDNSRSGGAHPDSSRSGGARSNGPRPSGACSGNSRSGDVRSNGPRSSGVRTGKRHGDGYVLVDSPRWSGVSAYSGRWVRAEIATHKSRVENYPLFDKDGCVTDLSNWFIRAFALAERITTDTKDSLYGSHPYFRSTILLQIGLASALLAVVGPPALWLLAWAANKITHKARRPTYYPAERARRLALATERRKIRPRTTTNPKPTGKALLEQFAKAKFSPLEMIRFGSMVEDLECYVDNRLKFSSPGVISGRNGGVKRWLQANCAPLYERYSTVMRYKQLSRKFRQALGVVDPTPAMSLLETESAKAIFAEAGVTCAGLARALDTRLDPSFVKPVPFPSTPDAATETG